MSKEMELPEMEENNKQQEASALPVQPTEASPAEVQPQEIHREDAVLVEKMSVQELISEMETIANKADVGMDFKRFNQ